jgi:hypothetical protein
MLPNGWRDDLAATVENLRSGFEALGHAVELVLVFEAGNEATPRAIKENDGAAGAI